LAACAPPAAPPAPAARSQPVVADQTDRTVTIIGRTEPTQVADPGLRSSGTSIGATTRPFNAALDTNDSHENPVPYLAEALPQLNTDSWQVFPDGTMQTSYKLKPNLTWHDGTALAADDFVFAWK